MGAWFVRYFLARGIPTSLSDVRAEAARAVASATGAELAVTNADAVRDAGGRRGRDTPTTPPTSNTAASTTTGAEAASPAG